MELLFELPLTDVEENCLQVYLSESVDPVSAELLVLHLLQRAQYVTAIRLNDRMRHRATVSFIFEVCAFIFDVLLIVAFVMPVMSIYNKNCIFQVLFRILAHIP